MSEFQQMLRKRSTPHTIPQILKFLESSRRKSSDFLKRGFRESIERIWGKLKIQPGLELSKHSCKRKIRINADAVVLPRLPLQRLVQFEKVVEGRRLVHARRQASVGVVAAALARLRRDRWIPRGVDLV